MSANVEFWLPAPDLRDYVSGYHRYVLRRDAGAKRFSDIFFPAWSNIRFTLDAEPWSVRLGRRTFDPVPDQAFFGPTSHAGYVSAGSGTMLGIGLTPLGWARLHGGDVSKFADSIVPLDRALPALCAAPADLRAAAGPAARFDAMIRAHLKDEPRERCAVDTIAARLLDPAIDRVADLGVGLGLSDRQVARLTRTCFGFTPKLLLRRARFLRALNAIRGADRGSWASAARHAGYWDGAHFLRDCHAFLGVSLGDFMAMPRPLNRLSMQRRDEVLGAPMQTLHQQDARRGR